MSTTLRTLVPVAGLRRAPGVWPSMATFVRASMPADDDADADDDDDPPPAPCKPAASLAVLASGVGLARLRGAVGPSPPRGGSVPSGLRAGKTADDDPPPPRGEVPNPRILSPVLAFANLLGTL